MIDSVEAVVAALGGEVEAAKLADIGVTGVLNWKARGIIPAKYFVCFSEALARRRLSADPAVFGLKPVEAR